jgi:hypothetical protein
MKLILKYTNQLRKLSALLVAEFEQVVLRANAWAQVEHDSDGHHTAVTMDSLQVNALTQTTVGAAGGASAQPATPLGYLPIRLSDGTEVVIPYHNKS